MEKEELLLGKRLRELSNTAWRRGIPTFTDFLNLNELNILHTTPKDEFPAPYRTFGGYAFSERQMAVFLPDAFSLYADISEIESQFPIRILKITPLQKKFAEELSHRDYLGALLNLGIERAKLGDILVTGEGALVFAEEKIAPFLCENLYRVRHTSVQAEKLEGADFDWTPRFEEIRGTVASVRLDSLLALAFHSSRSRLSPLIEAGKVYVNGKLITANGFQPREGDIVSVRGMGRFIYREMLSETKKGRIFVRLDKYV